MLIDKSKMAVDSFFSFLNLRKQLANFELKLETQTLSLSKHAPLNFLRLTNSDRKDLTATYQIQVAPYNTLAIDQLRSPTIPLYKQTTNTQT